MAKIASFFMFFANRRHVFGQSIEQKSFLRPALFVIALSRDAPQE